MDKRVIELVNVEIFEFCLLDLDNKTTNFYKKPKEEGFTGLYFKDENLFFALYPTYKGPMIYYQGKEYAITPNLDITLVKKERDGLFFIKDYDLKIEYKESRYVGFDVWSEEIDLDLFYRIKQEYKTKDFYERFTKPVKE